MGTKYRQSIWMAVLALLMAGGLAAQQDGPPIVHPTNTKKTAIKPPVSQPAGKATLLVVCDLACNWTVDDKAHGHLEADHSATVPVSLGQHLVVATTPDGLDKVKQQVETTSARQSLVNLELNPVRNNRLHRAILSEDVSEGFLLQKNAPIYPPLARAARISGTVVLKATISKTGMVASLQVVSGHPLLVQSAIDAVKTWRYRPYLLNGEPVEVETMLTINFSLQPKP